MRKQWARGNWGDHWDNWSQLRAGNSDARLAAEVFGVGLLCRLLPWPHSPATGLFSSLPSSWSWSKSRFYQSLILIIPWFSLHCSWKLTKVDEIRSSSSPTAGPSLHWSTQLSISVWKTKLNKHILMGRAIFWSSEIHKIVFCRFDKQVCDRWKASGWLDIVFKGLVPAFWEPWWHFICLFVVAVNFLSNLDDFFFSKGPARAFWGPWWRLPQCLTSMNRSINPLPVITTVR